MAVTIMRQDFAASLAEVPEPWQPATIRELTRDDKAEVLEFLSARPIHTVFMAGLINDNGLLSPRNRGSFYGSRAHLGQLEGVALIGHVTAVEAHTESVLIGFARVARNCHNTYLIRGERRATATFWQHFAEDGQDPRLICNEYLLETREVLAPETIIENLRPATNADLEKVLSINAAMAQEEGGVSPLQADPAGFRSRTVERIERQRVWVWIEDTRLIFKADVVSQTPAVSYLEGIYVNPDERRKGYGLQCLRQLCGQLLQSSQMICLTVNDRNKAAMALYSKAGFRQHSDYETIYLR